MTRTEPPPPAAARTRRLMFWLLLLVFAAGKLPDVHRPLDGSVRRTWRECDMGAIARNYHREGMNPLLPRIDWRRDGPGYTEAEFPFVTWPTAVGYRVLGYHEEIGRWLVFVYATLGTAAFLAFLLRALPALEALAAGLFWGLHPLLGSTVTSLQPDDALLCFLLCALAWFHRWHEERSERHFWLAAVCLSCAVLAKAPGASAALAIGMWWLARDGLAVLRSWRPWALAALAFVPPLLWYWHARGLWLQYGNSLGLSNEHHWIGWDFFTDARFLTGIVKLDLSAAWTVPGCAVALLGLPRARRVSAGRLAICQVLGAYVFYLLAARTTGEAWSVYYHLLGVPGIAILFGIGAGLARGFLPVDRIAAPAGSALRRRARQVAGALVLLGAGATLARMARDTVRQWHPDDYQQLYQCALRLARSVPPGALIVASSDRSVDEDGHPVAHDNPYFHFWMDRKGFTLAEDLQTPERLEALRARGAAFLVAEPRHLDRAPAAFREFLARRFPVLDRCELATLYDLR